MAEAAISNTGQSTALSKISPTLSITSVEAMFAKLARATALPNTSWAHVLAASGVIVKGMRYQSKLAASRARSTKRSGESYTGSLK
jgi:hypothetical protein